MPYIKDNISTYLEENFDQRNVKADIENLRVEAAKEKEKGAPQIPGSEIGREALIKAVIDYVNFCSDGKIENKAITLLR